MELIITDLVDSVVFFKSWKAYTGELSVKFIEVNARRIKKKPLLYSLGLQALMNKGGFLWNLL